MSTKIVLVCLKLDKANPSKIMRAKPQAVTFRDQSECLGPENSPAVIFACRGHAR